MFCIHSTIARTLFGQNLFWGQTKGYKTFLSEQLEQSWTNGVIVLNGHLKHETMILCSCWLVLLEFFVIRSIAKFDRGTENWREFTVTYSICIVCSISTFLYIFSKNYRGIKLQDFFLCIRAILIWTVKNQYIWNFRKLNVLKH